MQYRKFGKTNEMISILGFGAMRLPVIDQDDSQIDMVKATQMVRYAIDKGVNYLDTAYPYHGGNSESFCAQVMKDGYREKINIATKLPVWDVKTHEDMERLLDEQLEKLEVDVIDFYLLHALSKKFWGNICENDYKSFLNKAKADGKIRYAGFSFHDDFDLFREITDDYDWDFCQIQLNYLDDNYQAGLKGMRYAAEKNLGTVVMEPLRGGMLAKTELPDDVQAIWDSCSIKRKPAQWALKYLWNFKEISLVLSGMSNMEQVVENVETASDSKPDSLSAEENKAIEEVKKIFNERMIVNCTNCKYCMPCPAGVNIPEVFWAYNHASIFNDHEKAKFWLNNWLTEKQKASNCVKCGQCESKCPQNIEIMKHLEIAKEKYELSDE
jgi:predicted aldo/keto reductase-like oxidoreductase